MSDKEEELETLADQIAAKITEANTSLADNLSIAEGIEKLTGLPNTFVPILVATIAEKNGIAATGIDKRTAPFAFDLVLTAAAIGYAEGKKQAEAGLSKGAAS